MNLSPVVPDEETILDYWVISTAIPMIKSINPHYLENIMENNQRSQKIRSLITLTSFGLISLLVNLQPTQAQDRHRNAYGLGLDLHWYCAYQYGNSASLYMEEQSAYGFRCASGNRVMNIDMNHVCQLMYGPSHQAIMANANEMGSWYCSDRSGRSRPQPWGQTDRSPSPQTESWAPQPTVQPEPAVNLRAVDSELLELTNAQRRNAGQPPLRFSSRLAQAAQTYAEDYSRHPNLPVHKGSDGSSVRDRITRTGYVFVAYGENAHIQGPTSSPSIAIQWWMTSPGHRASMLHPNFTEVGFGYAYNPATTIHTYIQVFGTPQGR
jgi:uncharacterized protein YkwD/predicted nucleic acid-binding Zn ribbon protein